VGPAPLLDRADALTDQLVDVVVKPKGVVSYLCLDGAVHEHWHVETHGWVPPPPRPLPVGLDDGDDVVVGGGR